MTNRESPLRLDGCHLWPPVVDTGAAVIAGSAAVLSDQGKYLPQEDKQTYMIGSILLGGVFAMSALMGYGEYYKCDDSTQDR